MSKFTLTSDKQKQEDYFCIRDLETRLIQQEISVNGKYLTEQQVEEFIFNNMADIIQLSRDGWNPFDLVAILEGNPHNVEGGFKKTAEKYKQETDLEEELTFTHEGDGVEYEIWKHTTGALYKVPISIERNFNQAEKL